MLHQQDALDHHKESGVMLPDEIYREPVAARIGRIPAVPFAYSIIECEVFGYQGVSYENSRVIWARAGTGCRTGAAVVVLVCVAVTR
ncbi:Uncharacterised protein [Mycobacteroides abscessus subsp. abscessus]|nr:Uncharacterised protein [Mycobacteroides abscessus subsp. abscessus]